MRVLIIAVQILVSLFVTASTMPLVLVAVPATQNERVGLAAMGGLFVVSFAIVSLAWPGRKSRRSS